MVIGPVPEGGGQVSALTDAENQVTLYDYNARGEKIRETYPDHVSGAAVGTAGYGIVQFSYDPAGRIRMKSDQQGDTCTFTYNLAGQLLSRAYRTAANSPSGTAALYYHRNQQYSIVGLSDAAGTLVERYAYTAYGELENLNGVRSSFRALGG